MIKQSSNIEHQKESLRAFLPNEMLRIKESLSSESTDFLSNIEQNERHRSTFISDYRRIPIGCESFFTVLRKWNSYTPSLPANTETGRSLNQYSIGGGYFLYAQGEEGTLDPGYGLVIDPGYNFIHNFGQAGFCLDDIDGILITHAHNDHTNDFESILSLLYQRNDKFIGRKTPKKVDLYLNVGSFKKFSNYLDLTKTDKKGYIGNVIVMSPGQVYKIPNRDNLDLEILTLYTNHNEIVTHDYSLGICFKLSGRNILLTGDTGWKFDTSQKNERFLKQNNVNIRTESESGCIDVLVAHIGSIKRKEFDIHVDSENIETFYYPSHLGILGIISVLEKWKPDLCIISEFGEELTELREKLTMEIENTCQKFYQTKCIPGDVGLFLSLDSKTSLCYATGKFVNWSDISYKDIIDNNSQQRSIKYYIETAISQFPDPQEHLQIVKICNGLKRFKVVYYKRVLESFKFEDLNENDLIDEISEYQINYVDEWDNPSEYELIGKFFALSCIISDPLNILDAAITSHVFYLIKDFLDTYHIDMTLLDQFFSKQIYIRPDLCSLKENCIFESNKSYMEQFVNEFKLGEVAAASSTLGLIGSVPFIDVWNEANAYLKIDIICEGEIEVSEIYDYEKDENLKAVFEVLQKHNELIGNLNIEMSLILSKMNDSSVGWHSIGSINKETLNKIRDSISDDNDIGRIDELLKRLDYSDSIDRKMKEIFVEIESLIGKSSDNTMDSENKFFYRLYDLISSTFDNEHMLNEKNEILNDLNEILK